MDLKWIPMYNKQMFLSLSKPETFIFKQCIKKERIGEILNAHYGTIIELEKRKKESEKGIALFLFCLSFIG